MDAPFTNERRDPASGVLRLGAALTEARQLKRSGHLVVRDEGRRHIIQMAYGRIARVTHVDSVEAEGLEAGEVEAGAAQLFVLPRPHVWFEPGDGSVPRSGILTTELVILKGVRTRAALFDPLTLVKRIPVNTLLLDPLARRILGRLDLTPREQAFAETLTVPTPIPMALWKRGLLPGEAGALVVAFNLIGAFESWRPGDFPRLEAAAALRRRMETATDDLALLGLCEGASAEVVDRAFRRLSLALHPDRLEALPEDEAARAEEAYATISAAYTRVRRSRRSRRCGAPEVVEGDLAAVQVPPDRWAPIVEKARQAAFAGDALHAKGFAIKALALSPPKGIVDELKHLLRSAV